MRGYLTFKTVFLFLATILLCGLALFILTAILASPLIALYIIDINLTATYTVAFLLALAFCILTLAIFLAVLATFIIIMTDFLQDGFLHLLTLILTQFLLLSTFFFALLLRLLLWTGLLIQCRQVNLANDIDLGNDFLTFQSENILNLRSLFHRLFFLNRLNLRLRDFWFWCLYLRCWGNLYRLLLLNRFNWNFFLLL